MEENTNQKQLSIIEYNDINFSINISQNNLNEIRICLIGILNNRNLVNTSSEEMYSIDNKIYNILNEYTDDELHILKFDKGFNLMTIFFTTYYSNFIEYNYEEVKNYLILNTHIFDLKLDDHLIIMTRSTVYNYYQNKLFTLDRHLSNLLEELTNIFDNN
jgi:hypothetical protein